MNDATKLIREGRADAERTLTRCFNQFRRLGCPGRGPAEGALIAAGQRVANWRALTRRAGGVAA